VFSKLKHKKRIIIAFTGLILCLAFKGDDSDTIEPSYLAFKPGEVLKYNIHYGPVNAGEATFRVRDTLINIDDDPHYYMKVFGRTLKGWDLFYKVRDHYFSYVDTATLLPSIAYRDVKEGDYKIQEKLIFNRVENTVEKDGKTYQVPDKIHDILSAIYYARCMDFTDAPKQTHVPINTFFSDSLFPVGVTYLGDEVVKTSLGEFQSRKFRPELIKGRIFKGQRDMTVYVSKDKNQVPLRIESKIFVGHIRADLIEHRDLKFPLNAKIE